MRSSPELFLSCLVGALLAAGCGSDEPGGGPPIDPEACASSYLDYSNFGEPFLLNWCNGCHSAGLPANMRQLAPAGVDFDSHEKAHQFQTRIAARAAGASPTMPPVGGPSTEERELLAEWITCGAR
jgi:uncharacterized membrane protein